ncbi:hypothetical protein SAMN05444417_3176 [Wenxinia saemankumensis]|uniref:Uncharacterized protein n=2 Tax=Wenxinia saemankumensis TaxID=1447782 RepID=A0A1M6HDS6_9RHOB|nr:hypothetical protein SAMN05444417_3176 [Wenxinia saemankumensis]
MISAELGMSTIGSLPALPVAHGPFAAPFLSFVAAGHVIG